LPRAGALQDDLENLQAARCRSNSHLAQPCDSRAAKNRFRKSNWSVPESGLVFVQNATILLAIKQLICNSNSSKHAKMIKDSLHRPKLGFRVHSMLPHKDLRTDAGFAHDGSCPLL
jgi:hypothetical protein